jgi:hypothetical protein
MQISGKLTTLMLASILLTATGCKQTQHAAPARTDQQIASDIQAKLASENTLQGQNIHPAVVNRVATLSGIVSNNDVRTLAGSDAGSIDGVKTVVNDLVLPSDQAELCTPAPVRVHHAIRHTKRQPVMTTSVAEPLPPAPPLPARPMFVRPVPVVVVPPPPAFYPGPGIYPYHRAWRRGWVRPGPRVVYARPY